ncbi:recombinase family protein [Streptomyces sp. NPDC059575]|uniref:recombinase family protein n=1 Tax=Streptomyces sp. NPDC059575 TaxID=3346872 RepID=UPI0036C104E5
MLADLASGVIDGVIFYDLDRLVRQPRDLEDLIDIVEHTQRPVVGTTGCRTDLVNDSDRDVPRMMCVMALKSSEDTARWVARMYLATAQVGKIQGRIAYGWIRKGAGKSHLVEDEAEGRRRHLQRLPHRRNRLRHCHAAQPTRWRRKVVVLALRARRGSAQAS